MTLYVINHLIAIGTHGPPFVRKAFCIGYHVHKQLDVLPGANTCLRLPEMNEWQGVLAWTTSMVKIPGSDEVTAYAFKQVLVRDIYIAKVWESEGKFNSQKLALGRDLDALEWHPVVWEKGDIYEACVYHNHPNYVTLNAALIQTW